MFSLNNAGLSVDEMVISIDATMPQGAAGNCVGECAEDVTAYIKNVLFADTGLADVVPGYVIARKLNQEEYDNTVRDLFGFADNYSPSTQYNFAQDGFRSGFNNNAAGLTIAPLDVENYLNAAKGIADDVLNSTSAVERIFVCNNDNVFCRTQIINNILPKVYRRPVTETNQILNAMNNASDLGGDLNLQVKALLVNALLMPDFLFRTEAPPSNGDEIRNLTSYEIASRLSYFLWSSMPDDQLFNLAASGALTNVETINEQVDRMIADSKSNALAEQLSKQWFQTLALTEVVRDGATLDNDLQSDIETEVSLLVRDAVRGNMSAKGLLNARHSYVNKNLASAYGMNTAGLGNDFERIDFADDNDGRGGLLRIANFLMINAHRENNSPVKRGKWVLERLLCSPPPPANIPSFEPEESSEATGSLRTQTEAFFAQPGRESCNVCHEAMHGVGFAFEGFDQNARPQTDDNSFAIDASGVLWNSGVTFDGVPGLIDALVNDDRLASCMVEKTFAYAMGRDLMTSDYQVFKAMASELGDDFSLPELFKKVSTSALMLQRSSEK